jgi:capsular polysaccharide biosynthesis protein
VYAVELVRVADVHHTPGYGAVIDPEGRVLQSSVAGAEYFTPTLGALPSVTAFKGEAFFAPTGVEPRRAAATVFVPWGALYNYGHFLLDALPGVGVDGDRGLLSRFPAISPP